MFKFFKNRNTRLRFIARMRLKLKMMLSLDVSPKVLAKASAWGALIGISPYVTIPFIFAFTTKVGLILLGMDASFTFDWSNITLSSLFEAGKTLFIPFIVGTHFVGIVCAIPTYFIVYFIAKRYKVYKGVDEKGKEKYGIK